MNMKSIHAFKMFSPIEDLASIYKRGQIILTIIMIKHSSLLNRKLLMDSSGGCATGLDDIAPGQQVVTIGSIGKDG